MQSFSVPISGTAAEAATYMDCYLRNRVRLSLENCINDRPRDPIRFLAHSLRQQSIVEVTSNHALESACAHAEYTSASPSKPPRWAAPPSVRLENGVKYELRPLAHDFRRAAGKPPDAEATASPPVFPSVHYEAGISSYEVASCLRQLHVKDPTAPLVLLVECPDPLSGVFFFEGVAYCCTSATRKPVHEASPPPPITVLQKALGVEKVSEIVTAIRAAATDAVATVQVNFLPSIQVDYLAVFDLLDRALGSGAQATGPSTPHSPSPLACRTLPSVLFVSYKPDSAHLTYARLLASYGPHYEAAQRAMLQEFRAAQLERKRTYTYAYAIDYWAKVQRRRQASGGAARTLNSPEKQPSSIGAALPSPDKSATSSAAAGKQSAPAAAGDIKRTAPKPAKRKILNYDAAHQAEDDVFLVIVRRLEHGAATLIQSVYRGYRERRIYAEARGAPHCTAGASAVGSPKQSQKSATVRHSSDADILPPLLRACLERLVREGDAFGSLWGDYVTSPAPDSRRYWIYRPVQHHDSGGVAARQGEAHATEGWVQEELLIPPSRATRPRLHLNLLQRLRNYLALAECTSLQDNVQLLMDSPGMSVLQRRAYDGIKSICLNLFHVAYAELQQRQPSGLPPSFSAYMRQMHAIVLGWLSTPHDCSLLFQAIQTMTADAVLHPNVQNACSRGSSGSHSATDRAMSYVVQSQLAANEAILIARHSLSVSEAVAPAAEVAATTVYEVAPQLYITQQPLLPPNEWVHAVTTLWRSTGDCVADARAASVEWMTTASFPLGCVNGTPVAAVRRFDTQQVEGVSPYDFFVPRLHSSATKVSHAPARGTWEGGSVTPAAPTAQAAAAMQAWMQGSLADAADVGLKQHIRKSLSSESGVVYFMAATHKGGMVTDAFTTVSPKAILRREVLRTPCMEVAPESCARVDNRCSTSNSDVSGVLSAAHSQPRRPAPRGEGWEPLKEGAALARTARARCSLSNTASNVTLLSNSAEASGCSRVTSAPASLATEPMVHPSAVLPNAKLEASGALEKDAVAVLTADEVARDVSAALPESSFRHTRVSLCFFAGPILLEGLDAFLDRVAATLQRETPTASLVLAMDLPSQGFYALAAALLAFRLHDTRDISAWLNSRAAVAPAVSPGAPRGDVAKNPHVSFLSGFHEVLELALPAPSRPRAAGHSTAVQAAVQHVSQLMNGAPLSHLNLVARLGCAVQEAETAIDPSHAIIRATQLAEQYALLVLLDYYLWSSLASFAPTGASPKNHGVLVRMTINFAFTAFVKTVPAALDWISHIDPWQMSSLDALHLRYSNALRRWDDKHYVCFGEY
ncbi:hypothetical protein JIQ42_01051 [Leishmania sp. Namibia]|uniref:hypothetical protein n=1 Tax=Leishmania sp. Namibia TaxID=2802991 RepID=UPI001B549FD8|nr:hypothetical protein JIQ42_01051 [Leishmania sp. Namibia]